MIELPPLIGSSTGVHRVFRGFLGCAGNRAEGGSLGRPYAAAPEEIHMIEELLNNQQPRGGVDRGLQDAKHLELMGYINYYVCLTREIAVKLWAGAYSPAEVAEPNYVPKPRSA